MKKAPIFVRELTDAERVELEAGLRSRDRFTLRRCQIILASARGEHAIPLGRVLGCTDETVRNAIKAFNAHGLAALTAGSHRPQTIERAFTDANAERLKDLLHHTPRQYGQPTSVWTLNLAAEVSFAEGLTAERVSGETIRATLKRLKVGWKRAKDWITSPDPAYARRKKRRDRLIQVVMGQPDWALGFQDETWWSRFAQPHLHTWVEKDQALKLVEKTPDPADPDPKALACYGLLVRSAFQDGTWHEQLWLRFAEGNPNSALTIEYLGWCCDKLQAAGKKVLVLIWDNASWHLSQTVRAWLHAHNQLVKQSRHGVRIIVCALPIKSPWLNPIEPMWVHGKRRVVEPDRVLSAHELAERVCDTFDQPYEPHLSRSKNVS